MSNDYLSKGYPLILLFIIVAAFAAMVGMVAPVLRFLSESETSYGSLDRAAFGGAGVGLLVGAMIGVSHYRSMLGMTVGSGTGAFAGAIAALLAFAPDHAVGMIVLSAIVGSVTVIGAAVFVRVTGK